MKNRGQREVAEVLVCLRVVSFLAWFRVSLCLFDVALFFHPCVSTSIQDDVRLGIALFFQYPALAVPKLYLGLSLETYPGS